MSLLMSVIQLIGVVPIINKLSVTPEGAPGCVIYYCIVVSLLCSLVTVCLQ